VVRKDVKTRVSEGHIELEAVGWVRSTLTERGDAPRQADEGAPSAALVFRAEMRSALDGLQPGDEIVVVTWLDRADRQTLSVHPRGDPNRPATGVFATRSADRPNPIGLHAVRIAEVSDTTIVVTHLEALDGTPILDVKPVLGPVSER
jgi:tRNA-Thr(GGU) m(6)t(6)A37 methyltransferase TsaA